MQGCSSAAAIPQATDQDPSLLQPTKRHKEILRSVGIAVEVTSDTSLQANPLSYVGELQPAGEGLWLLNPLAPFHLTVTAPDQQTAEALKELLDQSCVKSLAEVFPKIAFLIAQASIRCNQIDSYVQEHKHFYFGAIEQLKADTPEWAQASERDKQDLLKEFRVQAINRLPVRPSADARILFELESCNLLVDDQLLREYGYDISLHYLRYADRCEEVFCIPAEHYFRNTWVKCAEADLARRGKEIPLDKLLEALTLKEMAQLAHGIEHPPFRRKAKAVELLVGVADVESRIDKAVATRSFFQLLGLPPKFGSVDLNELRAVLEYEHELAQLLQMTYVQAFWSARNTAQSREYIRSPRPWTIYTGGCASCPYCIEQSKRQHIGVDPPVIPFHVGCQCYASPSNTRLDPN